MLCVTSDQSISDAVLPCGARVLLSSGVCGTHMVFKPCRKCLLSFSNVILAAYQSRCFHDAAFLLIVSSLNHKRFRQVSGNVPSTLSIFLACCCMRNSEFFQAGFG